MLSEVQTQSEVLRCDLIVWKQHVMQRKILTCGKKCGRANLNIWTLAKNLHCMNQSGTQSVLMISRWSPKQTWRIDCFLIVFLLKLFIFFHLHQNSCFYFFFSSRTNAGRQVVKLGHRDASTAESARRSNAAPEVDGEARSTVRISDWSHEPKYGDVHFKYSDLQSMLPCRD